ncbi:MAG: PDZ domain-containing protein, partial [Bacteroidia bacterium]|nr:PDZ domain-containing protein [Bacteroidia bacterium]MDW8333944.1 PDZ domain-containing protein [Bacteroidia bacterium]
IPSNIVKKVVKDIIEHGEVQRAFLGADVVDIDARLADKLPDDDYSGVYVEDVAPESAAEQAGLKVGDVVLKIDGHPVESKAEYLERLSYYRPGDKITVTFRRGKTLKELTATLTNREGTTALLKNESVYSSVLGCSVTPLSKIERQKLGVDGGFRLSNIRNGKVASMGLREGFVILSINRKTPTSVAELIGLLQNSRGRLIIEGIDAGGARVTYQFFTY